MPATEMVFGACICCYTAVDLGNIKFLCVSEGECLCCVQKACLAAGEEKIGMGMVTDKSKGNTGTSSVCFSFVPTMLIAGP